MIKEFILGAKGWGEQLNANFREIKERLEGSESGIEGVGNVLNQHTANKNNPHNVSKSDVGLGNVGNYGISDSTTSSNSNTYASSKAIKSVNDLVNEKLGKTEKAVDSEKLNGKTETDFAPSGYGLGGSARNVSGTNWNDYVTTGFYMGSDMENRPPYTTNVHSWDYCMVIQHSVNYALQEITDFHNNEKWQRVMQNGTWGAWKKISLISQINNWNEFAVATGYENWGGDIGLKYTKVGDIVYISGLFKKNTINFTGGELIGTLPVGFRPKKTLHTYITQTYNGESGVVTVTTSGEIRLTGHGGFDYQISNALCLDVSFPVM